MYGAARRSAGRPVRRSGDEAGDGFGHWEITGHRHRQGSEMPGVGGEKGDCVPIRTAATVHSAVARYTFFPPTGHTVT